MCSLCPAPTCHTASRSLLTVCTAPADTQLAPSLAPLPVGAISSGSRQALCGRLSLQRRTAVGGSSGQHAAEADIPHTGAVQPLHRAGAVGARVLGARHQPPRPGQQPRLQGAGARQVSRAGGWRPRDCHCWQCQQGLPHTADTDSQLAAVGAPLLPPLPALRLPPPRPSSRSAFHQTLQCDTAPNPLPQHPPTLQGAGGSLC